MTEQVTVSWGDKEESEANSTSLSFYIKPVNLPAFEKKVLELSEELGPD